MTHPNLIERLNNATPEQIARANRAVQANLIDGNTRYESAPGYACALTAIIEDDISTLTAEVDANKAEILRLVDALCFAHSEGFEWPSDPMVTGSLAHSLFIERGNTRLAEKEGR